MASGRSSGPDDRERLAALRSAESLSDLVGLTGADSEHEAYFAAKREWYDLRERELAGGDCGEGLPGDSVAVDGHTFHVHGVTHAGTRAEREFLHEHVARFVEAGASVYCEQGIRPLYFSDLPGVCAMDDYRWALDRCEELDGESHIAGFDHSEFDDWLGDVTAQFRDAAFALIDSGGEVYGPEFESALGDVASGLLTSHEDLATGEDFESFRRSRAAAEDPGRLRDLQNYYGKAFLPQPVEREWLRRHDPELELVTHARNERMADYAVYHNEDAPEVHLVVGAAHQPGVVYYLEAHRDGRRRVDGFEVVG